MVGGNRGAFFLITANDFLQTAELTIARGGPLVVNTGIRQNARLDVVYGKTAPLVVVPLMLKPTAPCDRFRVTFAGSSRILNFNILAFSNGILWQSGQNLGTDVLASFTVDFPFSGFTTNTVGATQDFANQGIDIITLIFTGAFWASDYAVSNVAITGP